MVGVNPRQLIEALLFASSEPLSLKQLKEVTDQLEPLTAKQLSKIVQELKSEYEQQQKPYQLDEIAEGYMLRTRPEFGPYLQLLGLARRGEKLSQAASEVLAIIAYKQPITRVQIEAIRGIDSTGILHNLLERELIQAVGKMEAPGRPTLYGISKKFLLHFGLDSLDDLKNKQL